MVACGVGCWPVRVTVATVAVDPASRMLGSFAELSSGSCPSETNGANQVATRQTKPVICDRTIRRSRRILGVRSLRFRGPSMGTYPIAICYLYLNIQVAWCPENCHIQLQVFELVLHNFSLLDAEKLNPQLHLNRLPGHVNRLQ